MPWWIDLRPSTESLFTEPLHFSIKMPDTQKQLRGVYIVTEPGCMNPQAGAFRHINIGVKELNKHFTMTSLLPEVTEAPDPPVRQSASPPEDIDSE